MTARSHRYAREGVEPFPKAPPVNVRYFYASPLPIDDPLSPVPPPTTGPPATSKLSPRPFSEYDNTQLDRAWNDLRQKILKYREERDAEKAAAVKNAAEERLRKHSGQRQVHESRTWPREPSQSRSRQGSTSASAYGSPATRDLTPSGLVRRSLDGTNDGSAGRTRAASRASLRPSLNVLDPTTNNDLMVDSGGDGLTGMPFARAPSRKKVVSLSKKSSLTFEKELGAEDAESVDTASVPPRTPAEPDIKIPVGVSRLHQVSMPQCLLEPIYWSPVHDIAAVMRGIWFYKDTMLPVETDVSNMLEAGYLSVRPWTDTWNDQLNSAVEAGAAGEEKILHSLWPAEDTTKVPGSRPSTAMSMTGPQEEVTPEQKRAEALHVACDVIDATIGTSIDTKAAGKLVLGQEPNARLYLRSGVIYTNATQAYILRPNLQPSAYYARRPLANCLRKGWNVGIPVVRGFDQELWDKLHPEKKGRKAAQAEEGVSTSQGGRPAGARLRSDKSLASSERPLVTDLVLVIHGIGQKLSERMESFHFTHAMNAFRREVNVELGDAAVKPHLRKDAGGIMVLPINWRSTLKFEEGGYRDEPDDPNLNNYNLKDITPEALPAVRGIISDVMLDIPYYLSHHQSTMISAVIKEANRVHRLWCLNNPGFEQYGRTHICGHSLGSVMAVDVLSRQPTSVPASLALEEPRPDMDHFTFDTKNLYLCGSPAGLFLLLKQANLIPRRDRDKTSLDGADYSNPNVAGEQGTYGCLAVDQIYNIINPYDPVALKLNAIVDKIYASTMRSTLIPSTATSWFSFGNPLRSSTVTESIDGQRPSPLPRLPSNVELETHNFTREELAEKRFQLLNDNGTIDFFLRAGGGALDIQYLTMLGAHSSYWLSKDFTRFIVVETGRAPGRKGTLEACRAQKRRPGEKR